MSYRKAFKGLLLVVAAIVAAVALHLALALREARTTLAALDPSRVDVGFAQSMSVHHQQAILMSLLLLDGRPTALGSLAQSVASSQLEELGRMRGWLRLWNRATGSPRPDMNWLLLGSAPPDRQLAKYLLDCRRAPTGMPGLASGEALDRLRSASGRERDLLYLQLMLAHHQSALPMARFAEANAGLPAVRELASRIVRDQTHEILRMQALQSAADRSL